MEKKNSKVPHTLHETVIFLSKSSLNCAYFSTKFLYSSAALRNLESARSRSLLDVQPSLRNFDSSPPRWKYASFDRCKATFVWFKICRQKKYINIFIFIYFLIHG